MKSPLITLFFRSYPFHYCRAIKTIRHTDTGGCIQIPSSQTSKIEVVSLTKGRTEQYPWTYTNIQGYLVILTYERQSLEEEGF